MPVPVPVAILGFSSIDRQALASCLQPGGQGPQRYAHVLNADLADLVIADADEPGVLDLLQTLGRVRDALFIGAVAPADAIAWVMPPADPTQVLRALDALVARRDNPQSPPRDPGRLDLRSARRRELDALRRPQIAPRVLLVDDSEVALHFLARQLQGYGVEIDTARDSDRALDLLTHHVYGLVFLDLDLGPRSRADGLTLCHQIRHQLQYPGGRPPMVVMVSAFHDPVDQVRGTLAGAEAYLGKPLDVAALDRLLGRLGLHRAVPPGSGLHRP